MDGGGRGSPVGSIAALYAAYFFSFFHRTVTGVLQPELAALAERRGWDPRAFTALAASAYFYTYASMQLPAGVLADALGARRYAALSAALMAFGSLLSAAEHPALVVAGRLVVGLGAAAVWISIQRVIGVKVGKARGALLTGLALAVGGLGSLASTLPAKLAVQALGWGGFFAGLGLATLTAAAAVYLLVDDEGLGSSSVVEGMAKALRQLSVVARAPHSLALSVAAAGTYSAYLAYQSYWGAPYLERCFGVREGEAASLLLLSSLSFAALVPLFGYLSDRVVRGRKPVLLASCALHVAAWLSAIALAAFKSAQLLPLYALALGAAAATHLVISPMAREAYDPEFSGTTLSFVNAATFAAVAVYQLLGYALSEPIAALEVFAAVGALALLLSPLVRETMR
jgi:MFS family permease